MYQGTYIPVQGVIMLTQSTPPISGGSHERSSATIPTSATGDAGGRNSIIFLVTYGGLEEPVHIELQRRMQKRL